MAPGGTLFQCCSSGGTGRVTAYPKHSRLRRQRTMTSTHAPAVLGGVLFNVQDLEAAKHSLSETPPTHCLFLVGDVQASGAVVYAILPAREFHSLYRFLKLPTMPNCPGNGRHARVMTYTSSVSMQCTVQYLIVPVGGVGLSCAPASARFSRFALHVCLSRTVASLHGVPLVQFVSVVTVLHFSYAGELVVHVATFAHPSLIRCLAVVWWF